MDQYAVAAVDDVPEMRVQLKAYLELYEEEHDSILQIELYATGEELLQRYEQEEAPFQILILDVELPGMSGIELARQIHKKDADAVILFLTAYEHYALDAFGVDAIGYLLKPVQYPLLTSKLSAAIFFLQVNHIKKFCQQRKYLTVISHYQEVQIEISQIIYIEKHRNICIIHCHDTEYTCYTSLYRLYQQLREFQFCYCHQGYVVNFTKVRSVGKTELLMDNLELVPLSRRYYKTLYARKIEEVVGYQELFLKAERKIENE